MPPITLQPTASNSFPLIATAMSGVVIAAGWWWLIDYGNRPGPSGEPSAQMVQALLAECADPGHGAPRECLFLFYHPKCPCTAATVSELASLLDQVAEPPPIVALAFVPSTESTRWIETNITRTIRKLPDARIVPDRERRWATACGGTTSGHILLVSPAGQILFCGGITRARGKVGDSIPRRELASALNHAKGTAICWPTLGCPLTPNVAGTEARP